MEMQSLDVKLDAGAGAGAGLLDSTSKDSAPLEWDGLTFSINGKTLLQDVSGGIRAGELTCLLGPSGAGKSTLLNIIAGRLQTKGPGRSFAGEITYDGAAVYPRLFRRRVAYMMQDEALLPTETPREALEFSASLRTACSDKDSRATTNRVLEKIGLEGCADTMVGSLSSKGLSGGERKRTSVGVELVTNPRLLLLDEPTSGLDAVTAYELVVCLKEIASEGSLVCFTAHQPSSEIFDLCNSVMCLRQGQALYQGSPAGVTSFLAQVGLRCPPNYNPADYLLFQCEAMNDETARRLIASAPVRQRASYFELSPAALEGSAAGRADPPRLRPSFAREFRLLLRRELRSVVRNFPVLGARLACASLQAVLFGGLFLGIAEGGYDEVPAQYKSIEKKLKWFKQEELLGELAQVKFRDVYGAYMSCLIAVMLGAVLQVILTFPTERPVFLREFASETYSVWAYVGAKWAVDSILALVLCILMLSIAHPMMEFESSFAEVVLEAWFYSLSTGALALFLGSVSKSVQGAVALSPALFFPQVLFSGCFVRGSEVPMPLYLIQWLNPMKYSLNLFCATEFAETKWGPKFMEVQDVKLHGASTDLARTLIFTVFFTLLATITLRRSGRFVFR